MKAIRISFLQMLASIRRDFMLFAICLTPVMAGLAFRFGIPLLESALQDWLLRPSVLTPYYGLLDTFFAMLSPFMFCFATAMVILEETDDHIAGYLAVTALGKKGYLLSRLVIPASAAFIFTAVLLPIFHLSALSLGRILLLSGCGALQGIQTALLIVVLSSNKLEGMAIAKLAALPLLAIAVPYFVHSRYQYLLSPLPTFWLGKAVEENAPIYLLTSFVLASLWIFFLTRKFSHKII